jgi:hypothetical protein
MYYLTRLKSEKKRKKARKMIFKASLYELNSADCIYYQANDAILLLIYLCLFDETRSKSTILTHTYLCTAVDKW